MATERRRAAAWQARANQAHGRTALSLDAEIEALLAGDAAPDPDAPPPGFHRLVVTGVERTGDDAAAVTLDVPDDLRRHYAVLPGQFVTVRRRTTDGEQRRACPVDSADGAALRVEVRRADGEPLSGWLLDAVEPGDVVEVGPPQDGDDKPATADDA